MGGQKNFARFNEWLRSQEGEDWTKFFEKTVALLIIWNAAEKIVRKNKFQGYHHNIVAYTIAWFVRLTSSKIDLNKIWKKQSLSDVMADVLNDITHVVNEHIRDTDLNVTEYCKKKNCWDLLTEKHYSLPSAIEEDYFDGQTPPNYSPDIDGEVEAIDFCISQGSKNWYELSKWLKERGFLTPKARSQCFHMGRALQRGSKPSVQLSIPCKKIWEDAQIRGWEPE